MESLGTLLYYFISILQGTTFIYVILSWIVPPGDPIRQFLARLLEPLIMPIRQIVPPTGGMDLSVLVFFVILEVLKRLLVQVI